MAAVRSPGRGIAWSVDPRFLAVVALGCARGVGGAHWGARAAQLPLEALRPRALDSEAVAQPNEGHALVEETGKG